MAAVAESESRLETGWHCQVFLSMQLTQNVFIATCLSIDAVTQLRLFLNMYAASFLLICDHVSTHGTPVEDCCLVLWVMLHVYVSYLNIAY